MAKKHTAESDRAPKIRDRIKELRRVPASQLMANPKNWKRHPEGQRGALDEILKSIGFADALLARELEDGTLLLIDGHLRAEMSADETVPVLILDLTDAEADKLLATLDPLASMAGVDADQLAALLDGLNVADGALVAHLSQLAHGAQLGGPDDDPPGADAERVCGL